MTAVRDGDDRLVGRAPLLAEVEAALAEGGGAVLHGPTGVGKSALARAISGRADAAGAATIWVQGSPGMAEVPLGPLLAHLVRAGGADAGADPAALADRLLRSLPGGGPLCVVDDLQWVDDLTAAVVHQLHEVADVRVLATVRDGERLPPAAVSLGRAPGMARVVVPPLGDGDVDALVRSVLGGPADPRLLAEVATRAEGNPLFVTELLAGAGGQGALAQVGGTWRLDGELVPTFVLDEVVTTRLEVLDPEARDGVEVLALGERLALDHAERCLGPDVVDALDRAGLVRVGDEAGREVVALVHPVYGEVVRAGLGRLARRRHLRALAAALGDPADLADVDRLRWARWVLAAGDPVPPEVATAAGRLALGAHDLDLAERLARHAWASAPSAATANLLAEVLHTRGDHEQATALVAEARALVDDEQEAARTVALEALGLLHGEGDPAAALALVRSGRAPMADLEARLALYVAELYVVLMSESFAEIDGVVAALETETPAHTTVASRQLVAGALIIRGRHHAAAELLGREVLITEDLFVRSQDLALMAGGVRALALQRGGDLAAAVAEAEASHRLCIAEGDPRSRSMAAAARAMAALQAGDGAAAGTWATDAVAALDGTFAPNLECLAHALCLLVAVERADAAAAEAPTAALARLADTTERLYAAWSTKARARATARLAGDGPAAADGLLAEAVRYLGIGADEYASDLAHEAVLLGADPAAAEEVLAAARVDGDLAPLRLAHVRARRADDGDALAAVAESFGALGAGAPAAVAYADAAAAARAAGGARRARELEHRAAALVAGAGDPTSGPAPAGPADGAWVLLTERERDVAALVARGLTSKAVAAELHLSPRTVDNTLQRIYAKLGLANRRELAAHAASLGLPAAVARPGGEP